MACFRLALKVHCLILILVYPDFTLGVGWEINNSERPYWYWSWFKMQVYVEALAFSYVSRRGDCHAASLDLSLAHALLRRTNGFVYGLRTTVPTLPKNSWAYEISPFTLPLLRNTSNLVRFADPFTENLTILFNYCHCILNRWRCDSNPENLVPTLHDRVLLAPMTNPGMPQSSIGVSEDSISWAVTVSVLGL